jgi:hypothetical protein
MMCFGKIWKTTVIETNTLSFDPESNKSEKTDKKHTMQQREPIDEFTLLWSTRPEVSNLRAVHHTTKPRPGFAIVSETVVRPIRSLLAMVKAEDSEQAVAILDQILAQLDTTNGYDRYTVISSEMYNGLRQICDLLAQRHGALLESQGRSVHPVIEIEIPAIMAERPRKDKETQKGTKRLLE